MTNEEYSAFQAKLPVLRSAVEDKVRAYNVAYGEKKYDEAIKLDTETNELIEQYATIARNLCFEDCKNTEDPMLAAVKRLTYTTITTKDGIEGELKIPTRTVTEKDRNIDLLRLDKYCGGIGHDHNWKYMVERLNMLFSLNCAIGIGKGAEFLKQMHDCYAITEAAKGIDLGVKEPEPDSPVSNAGLLTAVRAVVTAMLGEEYGSKVLSHDVKYLKQVSAKGSRKALTIQCANHKYMRGYMAGVCHRIVEGKTYDLDYKKIK